MKAKMEQTWRMTGGNMILLSMSLLASFIYLGRL